MAEEHRAGSRDHGEHHRVLHSALTGQQVASAAVHVLLLPRGINCLNRSGGKKSGKNILFYCHLGAKDGFCQHDKGTKQVLLTDFCSSLQILQAFIPNNK